MSIYTYNIPFYNGYKLTDDYQIIGKKGLPLTFCQNQHGHQYVNVFVNGSKLLYLHRAVALVYHTEKYFEGAVVDHIDRNPKNNDKNNLRWVTNTENMMNKTWDIGRINRLKYLKEKYERKIEELDRLILSLESTLE